MIHVEIRLKSDDGGMEMRRFSAAEGQQHAYIYETTAGLPGRQICERLDSMGHTLTVRDPSEENVRRVILREQRRRRAWLKREWR